MFGVRVAHLGEIASRSLLVPRKSVKLSDTLIFLSWVDAMAAPTSVADLLDLVNQSLPLDPVRLGNYVSQLGKGAAPPAGPGDLAARLVRDGFLTPFQADHLMRGRKPKFVIGKYLILDRIGAGGMGAVYLCEHLQLERQVALKVLPADQADDPAALGRFLREAQAVAALNHKNIVRAYDVDGEGRTYFLVMEYVDGIDLQALVSKQGRLDPARAAHYVWQAAEGLQHAHEARLVHRDIKPANMLLARTGVVKILDLGLARFFHEGADNLTQEHSADAILGTADYLAPEQARDSHAADIRADIYSLGATFYFLLTGRPPFAEGTLNQKLIWHQMKAPTPVRKLRPEAPEAMAAVLERMMAKDAAQRYATPAEVVSALAPWAKKAITPPSPSEMPPVRTAARAGKPWRKPAGSAGSTVVQRASRPTALQGPAAAPNPPPVTPSQALAPRPETPTAVVPFATATAAPPALPLSKADDDWSHMFDDGPEEAPPVPSSGGRRRVAAGPPFHWWEHRWHLVGATAALLFLTGGVWLVVGFVPGAAKPSIPPAEPAAKAPETRRGPVAVRATAQGPDAIELTWQDPHGPSSGFRIERATDRWFSAKNTTVAATVAGDVTRYTDANLKPGPAYYYRVRALRDNGESGVSDPAIVPPDYGQGFTSAGLVLNGGATVTDKVLHLTDLNGNEARSAFYQAEVDVRSFTTQFRFKISPGNTADGFTFCVQGGEPTEVGDPAGGLGYQGISRSVAVKFDLYGNDGEGPNSTGVFVNGDKPTNPGAVDLTPSGIVLHGGRTYDVRIEYKEKKLTLNIADAEEPAKKFAHTFDVDVPAAVRGPTGCVGFTGGTGGAGANQDILSWTWKSNAAGE